MYKVTILGSGAAPGVPSIALGWGRCDAANPKNCRTRTSTYIEYNGIGLLVDTSPDLRWQLLQNHINSLDGVLYTHSHADHLHGIDDLREINRLKKTSLNFYATKSTVEVIERSFPYLLAKREKENNISMQPSLIANEVFYYKEFYINGMKIVPIRLLGHVLPSTGYIFNDGEVVYIADYRSIEEEAFKFITKPVKLMIVPLTTIEGSHFHASFEEIMRDVERLAPKMAIINHMASECDYAEIEKMTPENVEPGFDGMSVEFE